MNKGFYTKLAWTGIRKNRQLYYPYLVAGMAMVMVFYIFSFLGGSQVVRGLPGGEVLPTLFDCGAWAIGVFSIPFLFYTSSALIKRRKGELGLYNILGMNKKNIFTVLLWETLISYGIVLAGGLLGGIVFSKIAELGLVNIMDKAVNYRLYVDGRSVLRAVMIFAGIYFLILLNALRQIHDTNPIELLHSDSVGERPPKSRVLPALVSLVLILAGYGIVAALEPPMDFARVMAAGALITVGTFLLFLCASVFLCKILQGNKKYYYKTAHFVTVSTMSYRMKRNGASLAAICVLVTLILVMLSFSVSFYVGATSTVDKHYPYDLGLTAEIPADAMGAELAEGSYTASLRAELDGVLQGAQGAERREEYSANLMAVMADGRLDLSRDMRDTWFTPGYYNGWEQGGDKIVYLHVLSLDTYNRLCGAAEELADGEALVASETIRYTADSIGLYDGRSVKVRGTTRQVPPMTEVRLDGASLDSHGCEELFVVTPDLYDFMGADAGSARYDAANYLAYHWECDVNMPGEDAALAGMYSALADKVRDMPGVTCYLKAEKGKRFYALAGSLLFLALIMNTLLVFVTALIMYYKQISEGYEDQKRFAILRKIGMTGQEIKKSIHSQMLTVFALPLVVAGFHLGFTSNLVYMLLDYSVVDNKPLMLRVMWICYALFAVVYALVYGLTSKTYLKIVNTPVTE